MSADRGSMIFGLIVALAGLAAPLTGQIVAPTRDAYFPGAGVWEPLQPDSVGFNTEALNNALAYAEQIKSTGVVVLYKGRIVAERNWTPSDVPRVATTADGRAIEDVASLQKSVVSVLIGIAAERGLIDRSAAVSTYLGAGWSKANETEAQITIDHLLTMTSGLNNGLETEALPGTRWFYNTPAYSRLIAVLRNVTHQEPNEFTTSWLTDRIGMTDTRWITRNASDPAAGQNPYGLVTTARDMARLGILVLSGGVWADRRIVSSDYVREMIRPSQRLNPTYGLLWYANGRVPMGMVPNLDIPTAPVDLVAGQGASDRKIYVVPSRELVVTRLGAASPTFNQEFWARLGNALP